MVFAAICLSLPLFLSPLICSLRLTALAALHVSSVSKCLECGNVSRQKGKVLDNPRPVPWRLVFPFLVRLDSMPRRNVVILGTAPTASVPVIVYKIVSIGSFGVGDTCRRSCFSTFNLTDLTLFIVDQDPSVQSSVALCLPLSAF